jgi:hypothetical protein
MIQRIEAAFPRPTVGIQIRRPHSNRFPDGEFGQGKGRSRRSLVCLPIVAPNRSSDLPISITDSDHLVGVDPADYTACPRMRRPDDQS